MSQSRAHSRRSPIPAGGGGDMQQATLGFATELLSTLVAVPRDANAAVLSTNNQGSFFGARLDGLVGASAGECMGFPLLRLSNREMIDRCVLSEGGTSTVNVQFFTGRTGITE